MTRTASQCSPHLPTVIMKLYCCITVFLCITAIVYGQQFSSFQPSYYPKDIAARNINLRRTVDSPPKREISDKRNRYKHPLLITKDDLDAIVEDNVIVESNVLQLRRPYPKDGPYTPKKRVARGWNLQHVIVPNYPYWDPQYVMKNYRYWPRT